MVSNYEKLSITSHLAKESSDETDTATKERSRRDKSRDGERSRNRDKSRKRSKDQSPPRDQLNDTKDSWTAASPADKQRYQSSQPQPNQEVENMDDKLERLKAGRKFERRMSEL